jgi:amidase
MSRSISAKRKRRWQDVAQEAQEYRASSMRVIAADMAAVRIPESIHLPKNVMNIPSDYLTERDIQMTTAAPEELLANLAAGQTTAVAVAMAFLRRSYVAQNLVCFNICMTVLLFSQ